MHSTLTVYAVCFMCTVYTLGIMTELKFHFHDPFNLYIYLQCKCLTVISVIIFNIHLEKLFDWTTHFVWCSFSIQCAVC